MSKPVKVFLSVRSVLPRGYEKRRVMAVNLCRFKATWTERREKGEGLRARRGVHAIYTSKICDTQAEAVKLARKWLDKENAPSRRNVVRGTSVQLEGPRYVDTTDNPERFGYSHEDAK